MSKSITDRYKIFQSTFPRGERRRSAESGTGLLISIHVPAWGTTHYHLHNPQFPKISIHVPAWGTTRLWRKRNKGLQNFNPRSRVGNDHLYSLQCPASCSISIHVPAWGTTVIDSTDADNKFISIHVPAWGTTLCQPCHHRAWNFNPRSRVGNDHMYCDNCRFNSISIHVPAWGTTPRGCCVNIAVEFQSTFPRGERQQISTIFHLYICISSTNSHFSITSFCIFYLIHFFLICFFQLFMVRVFRQFSVYFWFALYRNNT